ncbi:MAG: 4-(cytidine 5'-diphospho)-2-C-methyl-D-erythritol kinase [Prevotellaceae bacterium]|jgi:4-diphosphocytidyl-2-C-methyl-D-erythritol kinase|nr:4-(cytidine 5'-diphospho)-2-C-methyl-D-erythritol kinase [Prevotellaceae bacterium]
MLYFPPAKVNIGLHVTAKRPDGFHEIETLFYPVTSLYDVLEVAPAERFSIRLSGLPVEGAPETNLCVKAYRLLQADFDLPPVTIYLHKVIPPGAGLGGGSSDATATLLALNELFFLQLSYGQLFHYAMQLGSDCAFFLHRQPMLATGRGEVLTTLSGLDLQPYSVVIETPPVFISTAEAYAGITPRLPAQPLASLLAQPVEQWKENVVNDFEAPVFARHPVLAQIKQRLYDAGAVYAAMSGSGSALFGLFRRLAPV